MGKERDYIRITTRITARPNRLTPSTPFFYLFSHQQAFQAFLCAQQSVPPIAAAPAVIGIIMYSSRPALPSALGKLRCGSSEFPPVRDVTPPALDDAEITPTPAWVPLLSSSFLQRCYCGVVSLVSRRRLSAASVCSLSRQASDWFTASFLQRAGKRCSECGQASHHTPSTGLRHPSFKRFGY